MELTPRTDSWAPLKFKNSGSEILEQSFGTGNRVGIGRVVDRPARLYGLSESIPGLLKSLKIRALEF